MWHKFFLISVEGDERVTAETVIEFELKVKCTRNPKAPKDSVDPDAMYLNSKGTLCIILYIVCI